MGFPLINPLWLITNQRPDTENTLPELRVIPFQEITTTLETLRASRGDRAYEIDGLVLKINQHDIRERLGSTSHHPRWAIAFKFDAPTAETRLVSIDIQIGRNGRVTPVANLDPVPISGSLVSRATLHNQLTIDTLQIGPGDLVTISKRGDVIPAVEEVIKKAEDHPTVFTLPPTCPVCETALTVVGAHHFCLNRACPERLLKQLVFFTAKAQMDISGLGEQTLRLLFDCGYVRSIVDLYTFDFSKLLQHPGFAEKRVTNMRVSVEESKKRPFSNLLAALGIDGLGQQTIRLLIDNGFDSMDKLLAMNQDKNLAPLALIPGIGPAIIESLEAYFSSPDKMQTINALRKAGLCMEEPKSTKPADFGVFSGQTWVITGTFSQFQPREKAARIIQELGGEIGQNVGQKTTHLLVGENPGSKVEKAQKLNIPLIDEPTFLGLIGRKT
jgi:DNA ligase (NAD+)